MPELARGFVEVATSVYAADPLWIPEDAESLARAFDDSNPWFAQGEAATWCEPGSARVAGFFQPSLRVDGRPVAFFGCWESQQDGADAALFARLEAWARARGALDVFGPIDFTTYGPYRVLLDPGPGEPPFVDEPYNPAGYSELLEELGFALDRSYLSQLGPSADAVPLADLHRPKLTALEAAGYTVESLRPEAWLERLPEIHGMVDSIFGANFAYSPLSWSAFSAACGERFIRKTHPEVSVVAWGPDGDLAGFFLVYPDYGPLVRQGAADRVAVADLDFARHGERAALEPSPALIAKTVGVAPNHRRRGVMGAMTTALMDRGNPRCARWVGATIRSDNFSRRYADEARSGARWYGLYKKTLGPSDPGTPAVK